MRASSPTWVCNGRGGCIFPGWRAVFPRFRRAGVSRPAAPLKFKTGNIPAAAGPGGMRGLPPYVRPGGRGNPIWPVVPGRHVRGGACPSRKPRAAANTPCRGRFHIGPPGRCRGPLREGHGPPLQTGTNIAGRPVCLKRKKLPVGAGFIPPAEPCAAANRADMESAPYGAPRGLHFPGWPRAPPNSSFLIPNFPPLSRPPDTIRTHPRGIGDRGIRNKTTETRCIQMNKRIVWPVAALLAAALAGCGVAGANGEAAGTGETAAAPTAAPETAGAPAGSLRWLDGIRRRALLHGGLVRAGQRLTPLRRPMTMRPPPYSRCARCHGCAHDSPGCEAWRRITMGVGQVAADGGEVFFCYSSGGLLNSGDAAADAELAAWQAEHGRRARRPHRCLPRRWQRPPPSGRIPRAGRQRSGHVCRCGRPTTAASM